VFAKECGFFLIYYLSSLIEFFLLFKDQNLYIMKLLRKHIIKILLSVLTIVLSSNCVAIFYLNSRISHKNKKVIKSCSDIKWTGVDTGIENKMRIDGFYVDSDRKHCLIFFKDGTCAKWIPDADLNDIKTDLSTEIYRDLYKRTKGEWSYNIGVYKVENDLITANYYYWDFLMFCNLWRDMTKIEYKIEDDNTISAIRILNFDTNSKPPRVYKNDTIVKYKFYHSDILPQSNNKMQQKKWMWNDVDMWKKWKKEEKRIRKRKIR